MVLATLACGILPSWAHGNTGEIAVQVVDDTTGQRVAARMYLIRPTGQPFRPPRTTSLHDHFVVDGEIILTLPTGAYQFRIECGAEYLERAGHFEIHRGATDTHVVRMKRFVDMKSLGWWSGDLCLQRSPRDIEPLVHAEDLHMAFHLWSGEQPKKLPWQTSANGLHFRTVGRDRHVIALHVDQRAGGALYAAGLAPDWSWPAPKSAEYPSSIDFIKAVRQAGHVKVIAGEPFGWDLPVWIASRQIDALLLMGPFLAAPDIPPPPPSGRPRDRLRFAGPDGLGRYCEDIYYHLLNCGLRIPPLAASGSGAIAHPPGYHRVYVHCGDQLDVDRWWENLHQGHVIVTNGPILLPRVNDQLPGQVFEAPAGATVTLQPELTLHTRQKIAYLEIIQNGQIIHEVRLDQLVERMGQLPPIEFHESGWLILRAVADDKRAYRGVTSGPFYVQIGDEPRISRRSAQYFVDWVYDRARRLDLPRGEQHESVLRYHRAAKDFWENLVEKANAE